MNYDGKNGIYYIHTYTPSRFVRYKSEEQQEISRNILKFKDLSSEEVIDNFCSDFIDAIIEIVNQNKLRRIGLVAVPPSKVDKSSAIVEVIRKIKEISESDGCDNRFGNVQIYDYSRLLQRIEDIESNHTRYVKASIEEHKESIKCIRKRLWVYKTTFIILDDVTTTGVSLNACKEILMDNDCDEDKIYMLALAKTG